MKKIFISLFVLTLLVFFTGCNSKEEAKKLRVSATLDPHSKILEYAVPLLKEEGVELEIVVLDNYYIFNQALNNDEVDANFFQHIPFFNEDTTTNGYDIVNIGGVHIEPFGFYSKTVTDVDKIKNGAEIIISNAVADHGRILSILANANVIELKDGIDVINTTTDDIISNPKNITFTEVNPELLTTTFEQGEGDLVAINGNYAIQVGLNPIQDAVILEQATQDNPYVNIVAVKAGRENNKEIKKFIKVLRSDEVKMFIKKTYSDGSVIPVD